ncbi:hypothetical protein AWB76_05270 [Caballeronia temeraria]|uniref:Uncharacterized protein n=1 Tax=Caballeronia temeraria TaxID=1777137 RepID=A0A158C9G6_9BURK|nr:hypothetical protein [Caballeronia temeraria]SAK78921.1 hypothetical protein AWB76_05270 [Caballeronia temeraria]
MEPNKKEPVDAIKVIKSLIDVIQASFSTAWKAVLLLGGLILVAYCYFESIVPEGLSLGDAFFLASAAFSFTCIALIGVGFGAFSTLWALKLLVVANNFRLKRRGEPPAASLHRAVDSGSMVFMSFLVALPLAYLLVFVRDQSPDARMHATLMFFAAVGAITAIIVLIVPSKVQQRDIRLTVVFLAVAIFGALVATRPAPLNLSMVNLGVRSAPGQDVIFSDAEHTQLAAIATASGVKVQFCKLPTTDKWGTRDARAVWHGVGGSSYIRLFDETNGSRDVLVRANRADVEVIRGDRTGFDCPPKVAASPDGKSS